MGTSIYVYKTEKEYLKIYKGLDKEIMHSTPIIDIFLKEDKKIWVISKITKNKERPQLGRSIVHFINGTMFDYANGQEIAIEKNNIRYNPKKGVVEFFPKKLRKAELEIKVDRFYGDELKKKTNIDNTKRYYDISRDRMNFILQDGSL